MGSQSVTPSILQKQLVGLGVNISKYSSFRSRRSFRPLYLSLFQRSHIWQVEAPPHWPLGPSHVCPQAVPVTSLLLVIGRCSRITTHLLPPTGHGHFFLKDVWILWREVFLSVLSEGSTYAHCYGLYCSQPLAART